MAPTCWRSSRPAPRNRRPAGADFRANRDARGYGHCMAGVRFRGLWEETVLNNAEQQFLNDLDKRLWTAADKLRGNPAARI